MQCPDEEPWLARNVGHHHNKFLKLIQVLSSPWVGIRLLPFLISCIIILIYGLYRQCIALYIYRPINCRYSAMGPWTPRRIGSEKCGLHRLRKGFRDLGLTEVANPPHASPSLPGPNRLLVFSWFQVAAEREYPFKRDLNSLALQSEIGTNLFNQHLSTEIKWNLGDLRHNYRRYPFI